MQLMTVQSLGAYERLPLDLFSASGVRIMTRHTRLTPELRAHLHPLGPTFFFAEGPDRLAARSSVLRAAPLADALDRKSVV